MEHDVEVVREDPVPLRVALHRAGTQLVVGLQPLTDLVGDRLRLPWVASAGQDEEVGVGADRTQVEYEDVLRQLVLCEAGDEAGLFERGQSVRILSRLSGAILATALGIQPSPLDLASNLRRDQAVDGLPGRQPPPDLARRDGMLVDLEDTDVAGRRRPARTLRHRDRDTAEDLLVLFPGVERCPLVGPDDEHRVPRILGPQEVHGEGVVVEPHLRARYGPERQVRERETVLRRGNGRLVAGALRDEHQHPVHAEAPQGAFGERDVTDMGRVERPAEDRRRQSVTVSSPISTSAPGFAPTARRASSSTGRSGGVPTTRKPRSVRKMRYARPSACGR